MKWPRIIIQRLAEKIKEGTKFFIGHGETNSNDNRESVGEVLASFVKEIAGKLSNVIIGHFPEKEKVEDMNVCSMEADVYTDDENIVGEINDVSGIALGNSDRSNPAFPGALRLNMVQCFAKEDKPKPGEGDKDMTFEEVKDAIRKMNIRPWQIYTLEDMKEDRVFGKVFEENSIFKSDNEKLEKENKEIKTKSEEAIRNSDVAQAKSRVEKLLEEGFTDKQKSFILKRFDPEQEKDLTDEGLGKFIENEKKEFADTAKLFGIGESETVKKKDEKGNTEESESLTMEEEALKEMGVT